MYPPKHQEIAKRLNDPNFSAGDWLGATAVQEWILPTGAQAGIYEHENGVLILILDGQTIYGIRDEAGSLNLHLHSLSLILRVSGASELHPKREIVIDKQADAHWKKVV